MRRVDGGPFKRGKELAMHHVPQLRATVAPAGRRQGFAVGAERKRFNTISMAGESGIFFRLRILDGSGSSKAPNADAKHQRVNCARQYCFHCVACYFSAVQAAGMVHSLILLSMLPEASSFPAGLHTSAPLRLV